MAGFEQQVKERAKELKVFFKKGVKIVGESCKKGWNKNDGEIVDKIKSRQHKPKSLVVICDMIFEPLREDKQEDVPITMKGQRSRRAKSDTTLHTTNTTCKTTKQRKKKHQNETSPILPTLDLPSLTPKAIPREGHNQCQG
ncbi:hypothetical protein GQ457_03G006480 [Hibiscus cannabinus]